MWKADTRTAALTLAFLALTSLMGCFKPVTKISSVDRDAQSGVNREPAHDSKIQLSWTANREAAVNRAGGGYRVYYSLSSGSNLAQTPFVDVPYLSGASAPTETTIPNLIKGTYYLRVVAYSSLQGPNGAARSLPSSEVIANAR